MWDPVTAEPSLQICVFMKDSYEGKLSMSGHQVKLLVQATEAGNLVNGLPNFARPTTVLAPINSAFYNILTGTGEHAR